jgi:Tfp pilus assembly protein PilO
MCEEQTIVVAILAIAMVVGLACRFIFMCEDE